MHLLLPSRRLCLRALWPSLVLLSLVLLSACAGGQVGEESGVVCAPVERLTLGREDPTPLGFTAGDVLAAVGGSFEGAMTWADGADAAATLRVTYEGGAIEYQDREWTSGGTMSGEVPEDSLACRDALVIEVEVSLTTDDGRLTETWSETLEAEAADRAAFWITPESYTGTLEPEALAPTPGDVTSLVRGEVSASGATVVVEGQVSRVEGDVASATSFDIGTLDAVRP